MKILVVAAMPNELKAIKEWIRSANLKENLNIDYLCCGVWNYETISSLEHYLTLNPEPIFIRNIWICGYRNFDNKKKSDPIQIANIINIHTEKEFIVPPFLQIAPLKKCFCSENVILKKPEFDNRFNIDDEMYFDMESRWVEFIGSKYKYPRLILKIPFDFMGNDIDVRNQNFKELNVKIDEILRKLPYNDYLKKILNWMKNEK